MVEELAALEANNSCTIVSIPINNRVVGCKWVYKYQADGFLDKYKARLAAHGFTQQAGMYFLDTLSPLAKLNSVRIHFSLATQLNWPFLQLDVNNAFLNGRRILYEVASWLSKLGENMVCKLNKSLYGLRQTTRQWFHKFSSTIPTLGFHKSPLDHSLFTKGTGPSFIALLVIHLSLMM